LAANGINGRRGTTTVRAVLVVSTSVAACTTETPPDASVVAWVDAETFPARCVAFGTAASTVGIRVGADAGAEFGGEKSSESESTCKETCGADFQKKNG
jgi:hypothetical protein